MVEKGVNVCELSIYTCTQTLHVCYICAYLDPPQKPTHRKPLPLAGCTLAPPHLADPARNPRVKAYFDTLDLAVHEGGPKTGERRAGSGG